MKIPDTRVAPEGRNGVRHLHESPLNDSFSEAERPRGGSAIEQSKNFPLF